MDDVSGEHTQKSFRLALGIERFGLVALRVPVLGCVVFLGLAVAAAFGVARIEADDSLSQLFRSETPEFKLYDEVTKRFPSSEFDVLVVVEGKTLLARDSLEKLRDLVTDLQLVDGTRGIISLFSARQPPADGHLPARLFPADSPQGAAYHALVRNALSTEIIRGKRLAHARELAP